MVLIGEVSPATSFIGTAAASSSASLGLSFTSAEPKFSSRLAIVVAPTAENEMRSIKFSHVLNMIVSWHEIEKSIMQLELLGIDFSKFWKGVCDLGLQ